jgi:hypothetical protein
MTLGKRVAKVEQKLADMEEQDRLADCICLHFTVILVGMAHEFEEQMNKMCPVHGIRRVGRIMPIKTVAPESYSESEKEDIRKLNEEVDQVLERYYARVAAFEANLPSSVV